MTRRIVKLCRYFCFIPFPFLSSGLRHTMWEILKDAVLFYRTHRYLAVYMAIFLGICLWFLLNCCALYGYDENGNPYFMRDLLILPGRIIFFPEQVIGQARTCRFYIKMNGYLVMTGRGKQLLLYSPKQKKAVAMEKIVHFTWGERR